MTNPLLAKSNLPWDAIPFAEIRVEHFVPALTEAISLGKKNIQAIKENPAAPTFENTILALETCSEEVDSVVGIYFNLFGAHGDDQLQALAPQISALSSAFASDIQLDEQLFRRVEVVYLKRAQDRLSGEQLKLVEKTYKHFYRNGANLSAQDKEKIRAIDHELSQLSPRYSENILKDSNAFEYYVESEEKLKGLPASAIAAAAQQATERKKQGWVFTLDAPSFIPFLTYSEDRAARELLWRAYNSCATSGKTDNREILKSIATLRHTRAKLLGQVSHAHFVLSERMAESPEKVYGFLNQLLHLSRGAAQRELDELQNFKQKIDGPDKIMPWDFAYYSEKLKNEKFQLNEEELRPYFRLENVVDGMFMHAQKLYALDFKERHDLPTYHEDVRVFEVRKTSSDQFVGLFYTDFFPRPTKKNGAWMTNFMEQGLHHGSVKRPHVSIVCNFTKPTSEAPSLLTMDEVRTLFHEFGHALHSLLSQCTYCSLSGTNVYWDFVELPSQVNENWILEKETLNQFARHYQTNEPLPSALAEKIKKSAQFQAGYFSLRQLSFAYLDMAWHSADPSQVTDVEAFEIEATAKSLLLPRIPGILVSTRFSHIFSGGYSAGYYSYKWAEVLDADAFELFRENGLYDPETARKFRENILERGGTEHPMDLYKRFRGREPDPQALLRRDGLIEEV